MDEDREAQKLEILCLGAFYTQTELVFDEQPKKEPLWREEKEESPDDDVVKSSFTLRLRNSEGTNVNIEVNLPSNYPSASPPYVIVRCAKLNEKALNREIYRHLKEQPLGGQMVNDVVEWVLEKSKEPRYKLKGNGAAYSEFPISINEYGRILIYSHHLYSSTKRKDIVEIAKQLSLYGFSAPGKPGVIVVEGIMEDCEEFYREIRSWNWQKITEKKRESTINPAFCRFKAFVEIKSDNVKKHLADHGLEDEYNVLFGL
jgi:hypothetical protein